MTEKKYSISTILLIGLLSTVGAVYYISNPKPQYYYDYTFRVAGQFFQGKIGFKSKPPSWLNEMIPFEGEYYSAFPYGSVLSMMPFAFLKTIGVVKDMPAAFISAFLAVIICLFLFLISRFYEHTPQKHTLMIFGIMFGTWLWTNLAMAGAWQLTLGFAMIGELGAIYFTVYKRNPILAGAFFALAFGNRTEIILTAPIFLFLIYKMSDAGCQMTDGELEDRKVESKKGKSKKVKGKSNKERPKTKDQRPNIKDRISKIKDQLPKLAAFCVVPFLLGVSTLIYNYARFHSPFDFGHSHIPGVLEEPWYRYGIFSIYYIPYNIEEMFFTTWKSIAEFPYYTPTGFGGSILMASPFLILILRRGAKNFLLKYTAWIAIIMMTFLLWIHGNAGGWQFSYRYAIILLPWIFVILLETSPKKITALEWITYILSFIINIYATYLFLWTDYVKP